MERGAMNYEALFYHVVLLAYSKNRTDVLADLHSMDYFDLLGAQAFLERS